MQTTESTVSDVKTIQPREVNRTKNFVRRLRRAFAVLGALAILALSAGLAFLLGVGHWLINKDSLRKANAIAVLSGTFPDRALEAAALYRAGYAKEIWLTHPGPKSESLTEFGLPYPSESDLNYQVLRRSGIPVKAIHVLESPIINTQDELEVIGSALGQTRAASVIVVTNKAHTRRVHEIWSRLESSRGIIIVRAIPNDEFQPSAWWTRTGDTHQVIHELLGIINVWAGLPVQSALQSRESLTRNELRPSTKPIPAAAPESRVDSDD
jgi:uncharacterized SAM-binding protein YcdF (DUF218 family)